MARAAPGYRVPAGPHRAEHVVSRSRFVTTLAPAATPEAAREWVERIRAEMPDATHHCWAFVAGPPGSTAHVGSSDAGEPKGTAGRPMLNVLLHSDVGDVVAVSSRWFGGTKLGTGGLSRAYSEGVSRALETLPTVLEVERVTVAVSAGYAAVDAVRRMVADLGAIVEAEEYGAEAAWTLAVPTERLAELEARLADATAGRGRLVRRPDDAAAGGDDESHAREQRWPS